MFAKSTAIFALFSLAVRVAVATPPACLIAAVSNCTNPSDIKSVCSQNGTQIASYLSSNCGNNAQVALSDLKSICSGAGVSISTSASSSGTHSATGSVTSGHASSSGVTTGSGGIVSATGSPSGTQIVTNAPSATGSLANGTASAGNSSSSASPLTGTGAIARLGMDLVGIAALGAFGAMLAM